MKLRAFHTFIVNLTSLLQNAFSNSLICVWPQSCLTLRWSCRVWTVAPRPFCPWNFPTRNSGVSCHSPPPGDLPNSVTKLMSPASPALARGFFTVSAFWEASFSNSLPIVKFSSVAQSCPLFVTTWITARQASCPSPTPGVHSDSRPWVSDAIQPSHPLSSPSPAHNPSQHPSLFQWVNSLHEVAKVLEFQL